MNGPGPAQEMAVEELDALLAKRKEDRRKEGTLRWVGGSPVGSSRKHQKIYGTLW